MRTLSFTLLVAGVILAGCSSKELSKEEALQLVKKENKYPKPYEYTIYTGDPRHAKKVLDKGLETNGFVTVDRVKRMSELDKPLIHFTAKAKPYLLNNKGLDKQQEDWTLNKQDVKVADEDISEITSIVTDPDSKTVTVKYTTVYKNLSPFSVLLGRDLTKPDTDHTDTFVYTDQDGLVLQKK